MGKATKRRIPSPVEALDGPTPEQSLNGEYERETIIHGESGRRETVHRNKSDILEKWIRDGGVGFEKGAVQVIRDCQFYWSRCNGPRLCAQYGERMPRGQSDGTGETEALSELAHMAKGVPPEFWSIYENVCRFGEPAGYAGSAWAKNTAQQIQSAKVTVGMVASFIAARLRY
jgi:hypothetical protein